MAKRPYFDLSIDQINELVAHSLNDLQALKIIQAELGFRRRPKAMALKADVDKIIQMLSIATANPPVDSYNPKPDQPRIDKPEDITKKHIPERVAVECANCNSLIFISTLEGIVQHLSCPECKSICEAQFKYGVMRTRFQSTNNPANGKVGISIFLLSLFILITLITLAK